MYTARCLRREERDSEEDSKEDSNRRTTLWCPPAGGSRRRRGIAHSKAGFWHRCSLRAAARHGRDSQQRVGRAEAEQRRTHRQIRPNSRQSNRSRRGPAAAAAPGPEPPALARPPCTRPSATSPPLSSCSSSAVVMRGWAHGVSAPTKSQAADQTTLQGGKVAAQGARLSGAVGMGEAREQTPPEEEEGWWSGGRDGGGREGGGMEARDGGKRMRRTPMEE